MWHDVKLQINPEKCPNLSLCLMLVHFETLRGNLFNVTILFNILAMSLKCATGKFKINYYLKSGLRQGRIFQGEYFAESL